MSGDNIKSGLRDFTKKYLLDVRVLIVIALLIMVWFIIYPKPWNYGATIRSVATNSSAFEAGLRGPSPIELPVFRERIIGINNIMIRNADDYYNVVKNLTPNTTILLETNKGKYKVFVKPLITKIPTNETTNKTITETIRNETTNQTYNITRTITERKYLTLIEGPADLGIKVYDTPKSNIKLGLDLQGGTRVILKPEKSVSDEIFDLIISTINQRLNVFGLSDVIVRKASDLSGNKYVIVEVAGANEEDVAELIEKQGKFEARINNKTVFVGGKDIKYVCMSAECSGLNPREPPFQAQDGTWYARFYFSIKISEEAAKRQAEETKNLSIISEGGSNYLSKNIDFYLDDKLVDSLKISADLKGVATTDIMITGSGTGTTREEAIQNALKNMKRLQTILKVGSLPVKLKVVAKDTISPTLGKSFFKNSLFIALAAGIAVVFVLIIFYKKWNLIIPILITAIAEIIITVGLLTFIGWNLDLAAIAGLIAAIGSGVDHQIVITDEILTGESRKKFTWKQKLKSAFSIIMGSYLTTLFAMIPLLIAGAGLLRGFAITTIVGSTVGVFVTRPAYASIAEKILKK